MLPTLIEHLIEHLDYEELYVNHVPKKYFNPKITRKLVPSPPPHAKSTLNSYTQHYLTLFLIHTQTRQIWESTSAEKWAVLVPFVINFSPLLGTYHRRRAHQLHHPLCTLGCWLLLVVVGGWWLVVGGWWLVVGGWWWWWLVVVGCWWWWLVVVGCWWWWLVVVVVGGWWLLVVVVGGWWLLVGGCWWLLLLLFSTLWS
jgi:hypothetical protein